MGRRGVQPTPTTILKLRGSSRARGRKGEVEPDSKRPRCPSWLPEIGKQVWARLSKQLYALGLLTSVDEDALARYCAAYSLWRETLASLADGKTVLPIRDENGVVVSYKDKPEVGRLIKLTEQLNRLGREFGLSPAARAGLSSGEAKKPTEGKARFFSVG